MEAKTKKKMTLGKYNIATGLGRSGTSLMMLCLRQSGIPITGFRYYLHIPELTFDGKMIDAGMCFPNDRLKKINKDGIWEIFNLAVHTGLINHYKDVGFKGDAIKVFVGALIKSEPDLINKTIIMLRQPAVMFDSMIKAGEFNIHQAGEASYYLAEAVLNAIKFLKENDKEYKIVIYEKLLENPEETMKDVCQFIGRGEYQYGAKVIDKSLNRSIARNDLGDIRKLEEVYQLAIEGKL